MKKHEILSPQARAALFDPPTDPAAIVRHYTLSPDDLALIRRRRRDANRLGFAVHLAYLRFPGRVLGIDETPAGDMFCHSCRSTRHRARDVSMSTPVERKHAGSISAKYSRICAFVLSAAVIIGLSRRLRRPKRLARIAATSSLPP